MCGREELARAYKKAPLPEPRDGLTYVFADFSGSNGLSRGALYDFQEITRRHSNVVTIDISGQISGKQSNSNRIEETVANAYFLCQPDVYEHVFSLVSPEALKDAYRVGRWVWETPKFPSGWLFAEALVHEVWAASKFCADVFRQGLSLPVSVVAHAVHAPEDAAIDMRARLGVGQNVFLGLAVMDIRSCPERKNPWAHVLAWKSAFEDDDNAVLVLKIHTSKRTKIVERELRDLIGRSKNILLINGDLPIEELNSLRRTSDVYLSLHRSEGYGLNIHEALLCGTPTIATDWSANLEYGPAFPNYIGIEYKLKRNGDWTGHYEDSDFLWADADIRQAARRLVELRRARLS